MTGRNLIKSISCIMVVFAIAFSMGFVLKPNDTRVAKAVTIGKTSVNSILPEKGISETDSVTAPKILFEEYVLESYKKAGLAGVGLSLETFREAVTGYHNLMSDDTTWQEKPLITIVDFNQSSNARRLWVINLARNRVVYNTWVAHGQGSGGEFATNFSNTPNSYQSSLGFFLTQGTYFGGNGLSLKLKGLDEDFNSNAFNRYVVVHGASYAGEDFIKKNGRLGRSQGCPALPLDVAKPIIETIKNKTVLYIDGPSSTYSSTYLDSDQAALCFSADENGNGPHQV